MPVATIDRIESGYRPWSPPSADTVAADADDYVGRHRKPGRHGVRRLGFVSMFYTGRHRRG